MMEIVKVVVTMLLLNYGIRGSKFHPCVACMHVSIQHTMWTDYNYQACVIHSHHFIIIGLIR